MNDERRNMIGDNLRMIRKSTGCKNQEDFFDQYDIGKYASKKSIVSGQGKADYISKLENGKISPSANLLFRYAEIGDCPVEKILGLTEDESPIKVLDPVERAINTITSSAYDACKIIYELYKKAMIIIVPGEEGSMCVQVADKGNVNLPGIPYTVHSSVWPGAKKRTVPVQNIGEKLNMINGFLKSMYDAENLPSNLKEYQIDIMEGQLQKVKEKEEELQKIDSDQK